jgi:hypothetical protein
MFHPNTFSKNETDLSNTGDCAEQKLTLLTPTTVDIKSAKMIVSANVVLFISTMFSFRDG